MSTDKLILLTGATGKVGQAFIKKMLADTAFDRFRVRALCHHRLLGTTDRIEAVQGDIRHRADVARALAGVTHVLHLATTKESPDDAMDVAVKGLFWMLEEC